ncbi:MAG: M20/M25/M40 family metallo-hydrolase [Acidobacteriota bacterium]
MKHRQDSNTSNNRRRRLALYSLPLAVALGFWAATPKVDLSTVMDVDWSKIDFTESEAVRIFQEYLRIDTSYPNGNEIRGAEFLAGILEKEGLEVHLERLGPRNANLWAELPGRSPEALVLHNHIDVEPIERPDRWSFPPFGGEIYGPFIFGRGAFDMKGVAVAQLMALLDLKRSGDTFEKSLIFLATGDEERDSWLGTRRLLREHPEWQKKFWGVLTEGGAVEANTLETARYWGTEFHQKRFVDVWVCDSDPQRLADLRSQLHNREMERRILPSTRTFFKAFAESRDRVEAASLLRDPDTMLARIQSYPVDVGPTVVTPYTDHLMRTRISAFPVEQVADGSYRFRAILHLNPDQEAEDVWDELIAADLEGFTYSVVDVHPPVEASPLDHEIFSRLDAFMDERFPEIDHGPLIPPYVATDARYFRQYGIPAYGFSPFLMLAADANKMKGFDERLPVPPFLDGVDLYQALVRRLIE